MDKLMASVAVTRY